MSKDERLQVVFDFDGIFSGGMYFNLDGKAFKHLQYSARYAIKMLNAIGADIYILTSDSTPSGRKMTQTILKNFDVIQYIFCEPQQKLAALSQTFADLNKVVYVADDLYDRQIASQVGYFVTHRNALAALKRAADYVSMQDKFDYVVEDVCCHIATQLLGVQPIWWIQNVSTQGMSIVTVLQVYGLKSYEFVVADSVMEADSDMTAAKAELKAWIEANAASDLWPTDFEAVDLLLQKSPNACKLVKVSDLSSSTIDAHKATFLLPSAVKDIDESANNQVNFAWPLHMFICLNDELSDVDAIAWCKARVKYVNEMSASSNFYQNLFETRMCWLVGSVTRVTTVSKTAAIDDTVDWSTNKFIELSLSHAQEVDCCNQLKQIEVFDAINARK